MLHFVLTKQQPHTAGEAFYDLVFARHHLDEIEFDISNFNAMPREIVLGGIKALGGIEQRLTGNAANIQAGPAEVFALDAANFHSQLRRSNRRHVTAGPSTNYDQIKL